MNYWIYKCNSVQHPHQVVHGDWTRFFSNSGGEWGSTECVPRLGNAHRGDIILAYQTDRNELVGLAKVTCLKPRGNFFDLILKPIRQIRVKVRPLKKRYPKIATINALRPGPIQTLYPIDAMDAKRLIDAADQVAEVQHSHRRNHDKT
jgi:hypothetical protein